MVASVQLHKSNKQSKVIITKKKSKSKYCIIATRRREIIIFVRRAHPTTPQARFTRTNGKALRRLGSPKDTPEPYCCARQGEEK